MAAAAASGASGAGPASAPASGGSNVAAVENENVMGALAYLLIPAIIFLVVEPYSKNRFIRFHSFQALFYCLASIAIQIVSTIVNGILAFIGIGFLIGMVISLALFVVWIILVIKAFQGQQYKWPLIGDWAQQQV